MFLRELSRLSSDYSLAVSALGGQCFPSACKFSLRISQFSVVTI